MALTLVTGASGFIGRVLVREMQNRGITVRGVSRTNSNSLVRIDSYGPPMNWAPILAGVETVIHLAGRVHVMRETSTDPLRAFRKDNVEATLHLARGSANAGVRRFVFVSTIKVNGERTEAGRPFTAEDPPNPQDPYALSKAEAETALFALGQDTGMEIVVIRPPVVHGPGVRGNLGLLAAWAERGFPSPFAAINNRRSWVHVLNLCELLVLAASHPEAAEQVFLVSDGRDVSTHEMLMEMAKYGRKQPISIPVNPFVFRAARLLPVFRHIHDRMFQNLEVDISKTIRLLGYAPQAPSELEARLAK